jgi:hypothetical protein
VEIFQKNQIIDLLVNLEQSRVIDLRWNRAAFLACGPKVLYIYVRNPVVFVLDIKHRPSREEQGDLLRPRLIDMIDGRHELVKLAALIDWEWVGFFASGKGQPATEPMLMAGLLYLQHACLLPFHRRKVSAR